MTPKEYNAICRKLPHTTHVVQWGGADVWKVGGKVFAIAWSEPPELHVTFKVSPLSFDVLREQAGLRPAPYLASRGMSWIQRTSDATLDDAGLAAYLAESHRIVAQGLPKRLQIELGFAEQKSAAAKRETTPKSKATTRSTLSSRTRNVRPTRGAAQ